MSKTQKTIYYILLILVSALFLFSAYSKLTDNPQAQASFTIAHLPIWFMYVVGVIEALGAIGLWIASFAIAAATGLFFVLAGAIVVTAIFVGLLPALFPLATAIVLVIILWLGKKK